MAIGISGVLLPFPALAYQSTTCTEITQQSLETLMIDLILKIQSALNANEALFTEASLPPIALIDKYRGQPTSAEVYTTPAMFIESKTTWKKDGRAYNGNRQIIFHVVTKADLGYSGGSPTLQEKFASETYYNIIRRVLDDLDTEDSGKLKRLEEKSADTQLINYQIIGYECIYADPLIAGLDYVEVEADEARILQIEKLGLR